MDTSSLMPNSTWPDDPSTNSADYSDYSGYSYPSDPSSYTGSFSPDGCTWEKCGTDYSFFAYRPSRSVNTAFATLFGISALLFLAQGIVSKKRWLGFTVAMICGCILEVVGYVGRIHAYDDPYHDVRTLSCSNRKYARTNANVGSFPHPDRLPHYRTCLPCRGHLSLSLAHCHHLQR